MERSILFAGTANSPLAHAVARELGVALGASAVERFPDGEISVRIGESVRGCEVFIFQPTAPPVSDHLVELLVFADACRRAAAARIVAIVPYFGYARSDRRKGERTPVTASLVAALMEASGIDHVVTLDAHSAQVEGFFRIPIDNLTAVPILCEFLRERISPDAVVVSPDLGAVRLATEYGRRLGLPIAVCHKERVSGAEVKISQIVGDVRGRACVIIDDMITTGGTIAECVGALRAAGAQPEVTVAATHAILVEGARERLAGAGVRELIVTDTVVEREGGAPALRIVSAAPPIADVVRRVMADASLHALSSLAYS